MKAVRGSLRNSHTSRRAPLQTVIVSQVPCTPYHPPNIAGVRAEKRVRRAGQAGSRHRQPVAPFPNRAGTIDSPPCKLRTVYVWPIVASPGGMCANRHSSLSATHCVRTRRISQGGGVCMASPPCQVRTVFVWRISQAGGVCVWHAGGGSGDALARYRGVAAVQVGR